jgi:beta-barrel assembly-enhancing protease
MRYQEGSGSRVSGRLMVAAAIVLFALFQYFMSGQVNPVTGEKQYLGMSTEQEIALGLQSAPVMARQMGGEVSDNDPEARLVKLVGQRLASNSDARKSPYQYEFHLLKDPKTINAFALPGGQIFITRGLLSKLETEAELAGVLGHEIGHVVHRHGAEHMATGKLGQMLATAAGVATSSDGGSQNSQMVAQMVNQMVQLRYGRKDELESDEYGVRYMVQSGYDPRGMLRVMQVLAEASQGSRQPEMLASHPHPEARYEVLKDLLKQEFPDGIPSELTQGRRLQ